MGFADSSKRYVDAMVEIEDSLCKSRAAADEILARTEPDVGIRQFILTNLQRDASADYWTFRIPIKTIRDNLSSIGDFPYNDPNKLMPHEDKDRLTREWAGRTLFVKGKQSK